MLIKKYIEESMYDYKCPYPMSPVGIVIHNTANDASARNEVLYMGRNYNQVSYHIAIDDIEAIQAIPLDRNTWNAGDGALGNGNRKYIAIEICYSKSGGEKFAKAEVRAAKEVALLLKQYGWGISQVKKHQDFSGKYCPHRTLDLGWQRFLDMISQELNGETVSIPETNFKPDQIITKGLSVTLKSHMPTWAVYNISGPYTTDYKIGDLAPAQFGGLTYNILESLGNDVYVIQTQSFGKVAIWIPKDNDSEFHTSSANTTTNNPTKPTSSKKYLNLKPHMPTWAVYNVSGPYTTNYKIGDLAPAQFGGLSYEIIDSLGNDVYTIQTQSFGKVAIWVPVDEDSEISMSKLY